MKVQDQIKGGEIQETPSKDVITIALGKDHFDRLRRC